MTSKITMPKLGLTMTEGIVSKWFKQVGDKVKVGEILFEVTTDKLTNDVVSDIDGILLAQLCEEGGEIPCTETVAVIGSTGETYVSSADCMLKDDKKVCELNHTKQIAEVLSEEKSNFTPLQRLHGTVLATPIAKKLARERGISLKEIRGTGPQGSIVLKDVQGIFKTKISPTAAKMASEYGVDVSKLDTNGRIMKSDVLKAITMQIQREKVPIKQTEKLPNVVQLTGMRKTIAKRMKESWETSPRVTYTTPVDTTAMKALKNNLSAELKRKGIKLTYNHIMMKVVAQVLMEMPRVNSSLNGDELTLHSAANIGLAVALENGLIVPNVKECNIKTLSQIAMDTEAKIIAAKSNQLTMEDLLGATFTISNLGMFGITNFSPIINQPEMAILGMCAIVDTPVVLDGQIIIRPLMNLCLTADHRVVDGAYAAQFLMRIKEIIETPYLLLL